LEDCVQVDSVGASSFIVGRGIVVHCFHRAADDVFEDGTQKGIDCLLRVGKQSGLDIIELANNLFVSSVDSTLGQLLRVLLSTPLACVLLALPPIVLVPLVIWL